MKIILALAGILNGLYMLIDGVFVLIKGKYMGPEKPGPWSALFYKLNINVFKLGPLFIAFGLLWLAWVYAFWSGQSWAYGLGLALCILTLWYLPLGTLFSIVIFLILILRKTKLGF